MSKRPPGLLVDIVYKAFTAAGFGVTSIAILLTLKNYQGLEQFSESLFLVGKQGVIASASSKNYQYQSQNFTIWRYCCRRRC